MRKDTVNDEHNTQMIAPAVYAADTFGAVDLQGYESASILFNFGAEGVTLSGTDKIAAVLKHSDDNSTWVAVAAADVVVPSNAPTGVAAPDANGVVFTADANAKIPVVFAIGYVGSKRYVQATLDFSGTHGTGTPIGVTAELEEPNFSPAS